MASNVVNPGGTVASPLNLVTAAASPAEATKLLTGDANPAFQIDGDGTHHWGTGGASATDTTLFRAGAQQLQTNSIFYSGQLIYAYVGNAAQVVIGGGGPGGTSAITFQNGEAGSNLYRSAAAVIKCDGSLDAVVGFRAAEGANRKQGTAVLVAGTVVVANTSVTATSRIFLTSQVDGGTPGFLRVSTRTAGTSFTILSSSATDTSTVAYEIFEVG